MMQTKRAELSMYICGYSFLFGGITGCLTGFLCSDQTLILMAERYPCGYTVETICICFAAELLIAVFALLFSVSAFGAVLIPVLNVISGYCIGFILFLFASTCPMLPYRLIVIFSFIPDFILMQDMITSCFALSSSFTQLFASRGCRTVDVASRMRRTWIELLFIWIIFNVRCLYL